MTQYERMVKGLIYDPADEEITAEQVPFRDKLWEFNQLKPSDHEKKRQYMKEGVVAVGNPCRVLREISDRDKEFFYKNERIDREETD